MWSVIEHEGSLVVAQYPPVHANVHATFETRQAAENCRARMYRRRDRHAKMIRQRRLEQWQPVLIFLFGIAAVLLMSWLIPGGW